MSKKNDIIKEDINRDKEEETATQNNKEIMSETILNLKMDNLNKNPPNNNTQKEEENKDTNNDNTLDTLHIEESKNYIINKLNTEKKPDDKMTEKKQSLMQNTKSWISKTWNNIKNYDYSKWNIFKGEEMEECLDAHGFPIKIPKKRHNTKPEKDK